MFDTIAGGAPDAPAPEGHRVSPRPAEYTEDSNFRIGRYEIRGEIGRGTMGIVYRAYDPSLRRDIALKTFHLAFSVSRQQYKSFEERFYAEARIAAQLSHPGIVTIHDVGCDPELGTLYMALQYLDGQTLQETVKAGVRLDSRVALQIAGRLADALQYAHSKGVVHRDIKPANVMLLPTGDLKILDFGIAKMETGRRLTTCRVVGTPLFMAPEQAMGDPSDHRADLFSLGSMLYTLLTGKLAFAAHSIPATVRRLIEDEPVSPSELVPDLPLGVDALIARALAKKPEDRYSCGQELVEDIRSILDGPAERRHASPTPPGIDLDAELAALISLVSPAADPVPTVVSRRPRRVSHLAPIAFAVLFVSPLPHGRPPFASSESALAPSAAAAGPVAAPLPPQGDASEAETGALSPEGNPAPKAAIPRNARLRIALEHPLKQGTVRVWVDEAMILKQELVGLETSGILRSPKGRFDREVTIKPGQHTIRLQVRWEDNDREVSCSVTLPAGSARTLEANLGRLRKTLSLRLGTSLRDTNQQG
jgi:serine/threonine-protein kinase